PNSWELAYAIVGVDAKSPELCAKISPLAEAGVGFGEPGRQTWFVQSLCYYELATQTGHAKLGAHVRARITPFLDGSSYSAAHCLIEALHSEHEPPIERLVDEPMLKQLLMRMGYSQAGIPSTFIHENPFNEEMMWFRYYRSIVTTPEFRA